MNCCGGSFVVVFGIDVIGKEIFQFKNVLWIMQVFLCGYVRYC